VCWATANVRGCWLVRDESIWAAGVVKWQEGLPSKHKAWVQTPGLPKRERERDGSILNWEEIRRKRGRWSSSKLCLLFCYENNKIMRSDSRGKMFLFSALRKKTEALCFPHAVIISNNSWLIFLVHWSGAFLLLFYWNQIVARTKDSCFLMDFFF
jgi:hypothetical protein